MSHFVLRVWLLFSLFCGAMPMDAPHAQVADAFDNAPDVTQPAGEPRRQGKVELSSLVATHVAKVRVQPVFERSVEPRPPQTQLCAHPPASRTHLPRKRVPRMRDDVGDH